GVHAGLGFGPLGRRGHLLQVVDNARPPRRTDLHAQRAGDVPALIVEERRSLLHRDPVRAPSDVDAHPALGVEAKAAPALPAREAAELEEGLAAGIHLRGFEQAAEEVALAAQ